MARRIVGFDAERETTESLGRSVRYVGVESLTPEPVAALPGNM